jgi:DNA-binding GntR family transcriptional regulator
MPAAKENEGYVPLSEVVYRKLRRAIVRGDLAQGAAVSETELAKRLEVSKTPVRHALTRLAQEGLLVSTPHKGAVVTSLTSGDLEEIYCLRGRLEGLAARTAAERLTDEDARVLPALLDELQAATAARDGEAVRQGCVQLHKAIWQASRTRRLPAILTSLQDYVEMSRFTLPSRRRDSRRARGAPRKSSGPSSPGRGRGRAGHGDVAHALDLAERCVDGASQEKQASGRSGELNEKPGGNASVVEAS